MGLLDSLLSSAKKQVTNELKKGIRKGIKKGIDGVGNAVRNAACKSERIRFEALPQTLAEFTALPQAALETPFDTAALTVAALCVFPQNREVSLQMLDHLRGPRPLSGTDKNFIRDRFMDGKDYLPRSYFEGATPENDYQPQQPYTIEVSENPYSYENEGYAKLFIQSGGADSPREVLLRKAKDGKWYLWDQFLLADIRQPESTDPWA